MRTILLPVILSLAFTSCSRQKAVTGELTPPALTSEEAAAAVSQPAEKINFHRPETWLIGFFTQDLLTSPPHNQWFNPEYSAYRPNQELVHKIQETATGGVSVLIVLGSWCPDSHREVPRFIRLLDECGMARIGVRFLGTDMNKFAPVGDYDKLDIKRVPTFIVYRNNIEIGRIIEYPVTSLEGDLTEILLRKN